MYICIYICIYVDIYMYICMFVCIYIYIYIYGGLSALCHTRGFHCQQRVLKTFPGPGYLRSKDGVVRLWHLLLNLYVNGSPFYLATA